MSEPRTTPDEAAPQAAPASPAVRMLVYGLGAAILVMTALLILGLALGWHKQRPDAAVAAGANPVVAVPPVDTGATAPAGPVTPLDVRVGRDAAVYTIAGDGRLIALHVRSPDGDEVIVVDTVANRVISRIRLKPENGVSPP